MVENEEHQQSDTGQQDEQHAPNASMQLVSSLNNLCIFFAFMQSWPRLAWQPVGSDVVRRSMTSLFVSSTELCWCKSRIHSNCALDTATFIRNAVVCLVF